MTILEIQEHAQLLVETEDTREAARFAQKLEKTLIEKDIEHQNAQAFKAITKIVFSLYLFSLEFLSDEMLQKMIRYNIREVLTYKLDDSWDFIYQLEQKFLLYPVEIAKKQLQDVCLPVLLTSKQYIGQTKLTLSMEEQNQEPTVANWIKYYDRKTATQKSPENFVRSKFFSSDEALLPLTTQEKSDLRAIILFYDYLKSSELKTFTPDSQSKEIQKEIHKESQKQPEPTRIDLKKPTPLPISKSQTIDLKKMMADKQS